ncbi:hypothetical protein NDU88_003048 [Pleurodeles waltl]|uniref:Uncharacterized protein n=1 Tax=Pleurodeles waltl TaxID=8319 RepID=A0AAV7TMU5_PLEWA|nr:hypothetical protein NDU88_003048 [Pleurodeles waltl]
MGRGRNDSVVHRLYRVQRQQPNWQTATPVRHHSRVLDPGQAGSSRHRRPVIVALPVALHTRHLNLMQKPEGPFIWMACLTLRKEGAITPLSSFSELSDLTKAAPHWARWIARLNKYFRAMKETDVEVKRSLLLHTAVEEIFCLVISLPDTSADKVVAALNKHFDPQMNPDFEHLKLCQARQRVNDFINAF